MKPAYHITAAIALLFTTTTAVSCEDKGYDVMRTPSTADTPLPSNLPDPGDIHTYKAPLYWSTYGYNIQSTFDGKSGDECLHTMEQFCQVFDWMKEELLPYGYDMICTDGWGTCECADGSPYPTHRGAGPTRIAIRDLVEEAHKRGLKVGIYDAPAYIQCDENTIIPGTDLPVSTLFFDITKDYCENPNAKHSGPTWAPMLYATHEGAKEWIDGYFKHFRDLGVDMIRMDFMNEYEGGWSRIEEDWYGPGYGRVNYAWYLARCCEAATKYGIFLSVVMPNLYNGAELEGRYTHMARIVGDTWSGSFLHTSSNFRGSSWTNWPNCRNQFDGHTYWNADFRRHGLIPDGDPIRIDTFKSDEEKQFAVTLQLIAGGPVVVGDNPWSIGGDVHFYQNRELLALNADRFVGRPMDSKLNSEGSNIWYGTMSNGDHIVAFFNRDNASKSFSLKLTDIGLSGEYKVRDLWLHQDEGTATELNPVVAAHGVKAVKLTR